MMKRTIEKTAAFLLVGCLLLSLLEALFVEKSSYGKNRGWKAAKDVDILILGNSHADGGLRAEDISNGLCAGGGIFLRLIMGFPVCGWNRCIFLLRKHSKLTCRIW